MHIGGITATMIASNALLIINFKPSTALFCSTVVLNGGSAKVGGLAQIWLEFAAGCKLKSNGCGASRCLIIISHLGSSVRLLLG